MSVYLSSRLNWLSVLLFVSLLIGCTSETRLPKDETRSTDDPARDASIEQIQPKRTENLSDPLKKERAAALQNWSLRVKGAIQSNWLKPANSRKNLQAKVQVELDRDGKVLDTTILQSSGSQEFDRSVIAAVRKTSSLPLPSGPEFYDYFKTIVLVFKPEI